MIEIVRVLVGLLNVLATWRFCLLAILGVVSAFVVFFRFHNPILGSGVAIALVIVFSWLAHRWQRTVEVRWLQ